MQNIILIEANEIPFSIIEYFIKKAPQSSLAAHYPFMKKWITTTNDLQHLSPWVTWSSLHRGTSSENHGIYQLGQDLTNTDKTYPPFWNVLLEKGISVGLFGLMHSYPLPKNANEYAFYIPDAFAQTPDCFPEFVEIFQDFSLTMVRKSKRTVGKTLPKNLTIDLLKSIHKLRISPNTLAALAQQIITERVHSHKRGRRRIFHSVLSFDVFFQLLKKTRPQFAAYFTNHVASCMHRYWAATFPEQFKEPPEAQWQKRYSNEIFFAMQYLDRFFQRLVSYTKAHPNTLIWIASSMGQKATQVQKIQTELVCEDMQKFLKFFGISKNEWEEKPAMHPQYNFQVSSEKQDRLEKCLEEIKIAKSKVSFTRQGSFFSITLGQADLKNTSVLFEGKTFNLEALGLSNKKIDEGTLATAYHTPEGILLQYDPQQKTRKEKQRDVLPITEISQQILNHYCA